MRTHRPVWFAALLGLVTMPALAQNRPPRAVPSSLSKQALSLKPLPPPKSDAHGHPPDIRTGTPVAPQPTQPPVAVYTENVPPTPKEQTPNRSPNGYTPRTPPSLRNGGGTGRPIWPVGIGVGTFAGLALWSLPEDTSRRVRDELSRNGPQFPPSLRMSDFSVTGFAKGGWPVVVDYEAAQGAYLLLTVVTQDAPPAQAVLAVPPNGRRLQLLRLPAEFGLTLKSAAFSITSTASATDPTPSYLRVYGFGCGPKAVGSVAIDELRFGPQAISSAEPETHFGFHTHATFDKMKAEFMQIAFVDNSVEGTIFDNKKIDHRVAEGDSINDQWSAKKARSGQIQFRVRGWMTVRSDSDGGDWVSAFSPDLVLKQ